MQVRSGFGILSGRSEDRPSGHKVTHRLQSVAGPAGPARACGVDVTPQFMHTNSARKTGRRFAGLSSMKETGDEGASEAQ